MSDFLPSAEDVDRQLEAEFLQDVEDSVNQLDVLLGSLRSHTEDTGKGLVELKRITHGLLMQGRGINVPTIHLLVHRLSEYLSEVKELSDQNVEDVQVFTDKLQGILEGDLTDVGDTPQLVRALPASQFADIDFGDITPKDIEVLLIIPEKSLSRIVHKELAECGYRVSNARSSFEGFKIAMQTKPDMVIASMELTGMKGIDLACAFAAMEPTHAMPFALLTSYDWGHSALDRLPPRAALLRKGQTFGGDLAEALARFRIT
ncbi:MAG: response regulator [Magnetovibrio sp.]|nr:response regulator [Magnetovibrio sp.]